MKRTIWAALLIIAWLMAPIALFAQLSQQHIKDSLRLVIRQSKGEEKVKAISALGGVYFQEVRDSASADTALNIYKQLDDEARRQGILRFQGVAKLNRILVLSNLGQHTADQRISEIPAILDFLANNHLWKFYYQTFRQLVRAYKLKRDYENALNHARTMYEEASKNNNIGGESLALMEIANIYAAQQRWEDNEKCLRQAIELLKDSTNFIGEMQTAYTKLGAALIGQRRIDEALEVAAQTEEVNRRFEVITKQHQRTAWGSLYQLYVDAYLEGDRYKEAEVYLHKLDSTTNYKFPTCDLHAAVLYGQKRYEEALVMVNKDLENSGRPMQSKSLKMMIFIQMGRADSAKAIYNELITDILTNQRSDYNARLDEIRTQYEVERYIAEKERNRHYYLFALGGCVLLVLLLILQFFYSRSVARKNRSLYLRIMEQDRLAEELAETRDQNIRLTADVQSSAADIDANSIRQHWLVDRIRQYLIEDNHLSNIDINREELSAALDVNRNVLAEAVKAVTGRTLMDYVRFIQLEEARRMLVQCPDFTIEAVASDCGFKIPSTFYRLFKKQYGISPTAYRKAAFSVED